MEEHVAVGRAIRAMRRGRMSLQELADKSNVSVGSLSQIENGRGNPSLAMLERIAGALRVDASQLLSSPPTSATAIVREAERPRQRLVHYSNLEVEMLTPDIWHDITVSRSMMAPGESVSDEFYSGEVCILVQRGRMRIASDSGETIDLGPGDAISYSLPRKGTRTNIGKGPLVFIGVFCPQAT